MEVQLASAGDDVGVPTGIPAPYGRACANCSRAKCRCIYRSDGSDCERCHRLKKDCRPSIPVRRKAATPTSATKRTSSSTLSRTAQLEQKLDGLVSLLTAQNNNRAKAAAAADASSRGGGGSVHSIASRHASPESMGNSAPAAVPEARPSSFTIPNGIPSTGPDEFRPLGAGGPDFGCGIEQHQQQSQAHPTTVPNTLGWGFSCFNDTARQREIPTNAREEDGIPTRDILNLDRSLEPTIAEAEQSLHTFRTTMLPYFPYVHLPPDLTAVQLRRTRPVLWLSIMSITCQRVPTHTQLGRSTHLRALFAHRIVFESDKSLDLLQGLLAFLTWVHYTSKRDRPTLSVMSQLAVSLVYDLGLHKAASPCKSLIARLVRDHYQQSLAADDPPAAPLLLDERRAALACYVLTSKFSIALKRCEPLRWTTRLEEHLYELEAQAESPLDHVLVTQVRLQRIADHIHSGEWQLNDPSCAMDATSETNRLGSPECRLLPAYVVRVVRAKINEIRDNIPPEARHYEGVQDALYASEMMLCAGAVLPVVAPVASMASIAVISVRARTKPVTQPLPTKPTPSNANSTAAPAPSTLDFSRVAALERCVEAVAAFWSFFRQITSGSYAALPFAFFAHFTHCVVLLYGLSVIDEPNWDRAAVRDRLHVLDMLDGFIAKLRDAPRVGPGTSITGSEAYDVFNRAATMLSSVRELWAMDMGRPDHREKSKATAFAAASAVVATDRQGDQGQRAMMHAAVAASASAVPDMPPVGGGGGNAAGPMTLDAPPSAEGTAWQLSSVAAATAAPATATDITMGEPSQDPLLMPSNDVFFSDLSAAMGIPEDYMFWDLFLEGLPQSQL
ncbi:hypothetical protein Sste5344_007334 [Sporothrix stenoceras]